MGIAHLLRLASRTLPTYRRARKTRWKEYRASFEALESRFLPSGGIIEFGGLAPGAYPMGITGGPDGNLWFAEINSIGKLNPSTGAVQDYPLPPGTGPLRITAGPDGNLWFVGEGSLGSINPFTGNIKMYQLTAQSSFLGGSIITGPDGNLWFTEWTGIGRINPNTGVIHDFSTGVNMPDGITLGPDGNLWFTELSAIGKINPFTSAIQQFPTPPYDFPESNRNNFDPQSGFVGNHFRGGIIADPGSLHQGEIAAGSDGNLWFITARGNHLAGINPNNGTFEELNLPPGVILEGITTGPDGNIWFTEFATGIGRINPATDVFQDYNVFLPGTFADEITLGPDGNLWFTHSYYIGEVVLDKPLVAVGKTITASAGFEFNGVVASFVDQDAHPSPAGSYSATVDWGDGTSSIGLVGANGSAGFVVTAAHTYVVPGSFSIKVTITDNDNSHDLGGSVAVAVSTANIGTLNPDVLQSSNGSKAQTVSAISTVVGRPPAVNLQPFPQPPVGASASTLRSLIDQGSGGMEGLLPADGQPKGNLDPTRKTPDSSLPAEPSNSENPVSSPQKREPTPTFETTPVLEQEINAQEPVTLWNLALAPLVEDDLLMLPPREQAQVKTFDQKSALPIMEPANANAMVTVLVIVSPLAPRSHPERLASRALLNNKGGKPDTCAL